MNIRDNSAVFPYPFPWEGFEPTVVSLQSLREDPRYFVRFEIAADEGLIGPELDTISFTKIAALLALDDGRRRGLAFDFELIASWYLGPEVQKALHLDIDRCREELGLAAKAAGDLSSALRQIDPMIGSAFRQCYGQAIGDADDAHDVFDLLDGPLVNVRRASQTLAEILPVKGRGRPEGFLRKTVISLVCEALNEAGAEDVKVSRGKGRQASAHLHFSNASGQALAALFKLMHPQTDESLLVRSFEEVRREGRPAKSVGK